MSEWITDRLPTAEDADCYGCVWIATIGQVVTWNWRGVTEGTPWMPITPPKPYVAPPSDDVSDLKAKYAKLNKHCLALFYAVCDLTHKDMKVTSGDYAESIEEAKNAADLFANDPDYWYIVDIDNDEGEES